MYRLTEEQYKNIIEKQEKSKKTTKKSKYGNKKVIYQGITFDSKMECELFMYLKVKFKNIILQPKFTLQDKFKDNQNQTIRAIEYKADFQIGNIVIDCKGFATKDFLIKQKLFKYKYPQYKLLVGNYKQLTELL